MPDDTIGCPHYVGDKHAGSCGLLRPLGVLRIAPAFACTACRREWVEEPPPSPPDSILRLLGLATSNADPTPAPLGAPYYMRPRGLGDLVARLLAWLGIRKRPGCGCVSRQAALNRWWPFGR